MAASTHAQKLAQILSSHGIAARAWGGATGVGDRVYVGQQFIGIDRGGTPHMLHRGQASFLASHLYPRQRSVFRAAMDEYRAYLAEVYGSGATENPPAGRWWAKHPTTEQPCYPTKSAALAKFLDANHEIVENYGGADYKVGASEFDAVNHKHGAKARTIAEAAWAAMPAGKPFCLDRIDLEALNDTSPAREAGVAFRLPDVVYESGLASKEAAHYAGQELDPGADPDLQMPDWIDDKAPPWEPPDVADPCFKIGDKVAFRDDKGKRRTGRVIRIGKKQVTIDAGGWEWGIAPEHLGHA